MRGVLNVKQDLFGNNLGKMNWYDEESYEVIWKLKSTKSRIRKNIINGCSEGDATVNMFLLYKRKGVDIDFDMIDIISQKCLVKWRLV